MFFGRRRIGSRLSDMERDVLLAEINHKMSCGLEDELTGNFFGMMRYLPFGRGLKPVFQKYIKSDDHLVAKLIDGMTEDEFMFRFWRRSDLGYGEIDAYMENAGISLGIEVKYHSALSGEDQLEREAAMLEEWNKSGGKMLLLVAAEEEAGKIYRRNKDKPCFERFDEKVGSREYQIAIEAAKEAINEKGLKG